jgi:post-segregation antitoxin (ccd killing protein)
MAKKETKKFTITIPPELVEKIKEGNFNCNKLVNQLLKKYLEKNKK